MRAYGRTMHRERRINRRQQGDLGEASAIEWLTCQGATVFIPFGHSPDVDLVAEVGGQLLRIQVKTSTYRETTKDGDDRWGVLICTNGGNQSWTGVTKYFDPSRVDALFVLAGDGRRWFMPSREVEGRRSLRVGGLKYSEYEVERGRPILELVYGDRPALDSESDPGERRSRRVGLGCKPSALALSGFDSHLPHSDRAELPSAAAPAAATDVPVVERGTAPHGQTRVSGTRQIVIPKRAFEAAGLERGDRLKAFPAGAGEVRFVRVARERR
jgi:PD-(D/E)XK endonuclease